MCVGISKWTNTQMFTFRNFNLFELLMKGLQAFRYQPIKIKRMRIGAFYIPSNKYFNYTTYIWTLNEWSIGGLVLANEIQAHMHVRSGWHFFFLVYQSIHIGIFYKCSEYQLI